MQIADFSAHMRAMKEHYKGYPLTRYPLPIRCVEERLMHSLAADFNADYKDAIKNSQQNIQNFVAGQQEIVLQETQKIGKNPTGTQIDDFKRRLEEQKEKAKAAANQRIDQIYLKLQSVGIAHPESTELILGSVDKIFSFLDDLLDKMIDFVSNLVEQIYQWLKDAVNKVQSFFKDTSKSVLSFFGSLFNPQVHSTRLELGEISIWNESDVNLHNKLFSTFSNAQAVKITIQDGKQIDLWKKVFDNKGISNSDIVVITLPIIAIVIDTVSLGILSLTGLIVYAISRNYTVTASASSQGNNVEFNLQPPS